MKIVANFLVRASIVIALAGIFLSPAPAQQAAQKPQKPDAHSPADRPSRILPISAKDFAFTPLVIHMRVNEKVELDVTAEGQQVGIRINPFPDGARANTPPGLSFLFGEDCYKLKPNEMVPIQIEATEPGTYTFSCCKGCGASHKTMRGQIIVDPAP
jgi:heme/copper-type cytochrome/quinol oxidase subunit 2